MLRDGVRSLVGAFAVLAALATAVTAQDLQCPDCHNDDGIPPPHDETCRDTGCAESCHAIGLGQIAHLGGPGTPIGAGDRTAVCNSCHNLPFEGVFHPYRINVMAGSPTIPGEIDLDDACGQCHGGGTAEDDSHRSTPPARYRPKATLAAVARGIHEVAPVSYPVTFTTRTTGLQVHVDAVVNCGVPCPTFTFDWDWGDGAPIGSGDPASHVYAAAGWKTISLAVRLEGALVGAVSRRLFVSGGDDLPPVASGTCTWNPDTWTASVTDTSQDPDFTPVTTVKVDWGDDSGLSVGGAGATFEHSYLTPSTGYTITLTAIDSALKGSTVELDCSTEFVVAPEFFALRGAVLLSDDTTPLAGAAVKVKRGRTLVKLVRSEFDGTFTARSLRPGKYKLIVRKRGYTFARPAARFEVGPNADGVRVNATFP